MVARSIMIEIREGRGCDGPWGPHAKLKLDHRVKRFWNPVCRVSGAFAHLRPRRPGERADSGYPNLPLHDGRYSDQSDRSGADRERAGRRRGDSGLFAVGEIACVSVHGANRLGGNPA
ncbi:hypothetical protein DMB90_15030 [Raoultella planticola]|uniref:FAD-dependent oxidoreductase 2 FAD-binding domain-containing protein n=1 Tax=Raoultella planticola TaxID=575 RepID=A0A5P6AAY2_RAOPL|nr:hypothetical protein DMB90_15030 [Raoultella planticola]